MRLDGCDDGFVHRDDEIAARNGAAKGGGGISGGDAAMGQNNGAQLSRLHSKPA